MSLLLFWRFVILPEAVRAHFQSLLSKYDSVFEPQLPGYNRSTGPYQAEVNMGPVKPPQRKGRLPQYACNMLVKHITREIWPPRAAWCLPTRSTLHRIAQWSQIIITDVTSAFYQIPLVKESMNYYGVATLFKGVWVNVCSAMGIPSSQTALEEVMCHVLGPLLGDESVAKSADDLYCGGNTAFLYIHNDVTQNRRPAVDCYWWSTQGPWNRHHPLRDARRQVTCLCPESALLAHTKLWMAFWPLLTYNSTPILSPVEDGRQMLSIRYRSGQGHLLSLMDAIPVQQSKALQPHVLNSPLPHHPTLLVGPFPQMSSNALASLSLSFTLLWPLTLPAYLLKMSVIKHYTMPL